MNRMKTGTPLTDGAQGSDLAGERYMTRVTRNVLGWRDALGLPNPVPA